jgi:predicted RNA-binding protein
MCQVSAYLVDGGKEELLKENVTKLEMLTDGLRITTLFEGSVDLSEMVLNSIDFSAGKIVFEKHQ